MVRTFAVVFLALALALTVTHREGFFSTPYHEEGDDAANALQIHRARRLCELHGNYSQWGFRHPGPAFFYAYAAGEWLLNDVAGVTPAPRNAHLYASTLLQLAFYAAAIALLARHSPQPGLTAALAIAAAALHYPHVERALYSTWPPDVLLMPFLCFVVASAAVFIGDRRAQLVMVIAGGFLVHGHIAQLLFVGPMAIAAWAGALRRSPDGWRGLVRCRLGFAAAALLGIFLLPLVVDAFAGRAGNWHDIILHLRHQRQAGQSVFQAVLCYGSYFVGMNDPSSFNNPTAAAYTPFVQRAWLLTGWFTLFAVVTWWFFRADHRRGSDDNPRFGRSLLWFWLLGSALTLVWGMNQDGGFTSYNSHFNHSLVHVLALVAVLMLVSVVPSVPRLICAGAGIAAASVFALALPMEPVAGSAGEDLAVRLPALLAADPKPAAPKLIKFSADDWYEAATLARALQRLGIDFYVLPAWRVIFGRDKVLGNQDGVLNRGELSVWQVISNEVAPAGAHVLSRDRRLVFPSAAIIDTFPVRFDFTTAPDYEHPVLLGIGEAESEWTWTEGQVAALTFSAPPITDSLELTLDASGLVTPRTPAGQRLRLFVNGHLICKHVFSDTRHRLQARIPSVQWNDRSPQIIVLELPDAIAPASFGNSSDRRLLGLRLYELSLVPVTAGAN